MRAAALLAAAAQAHVPVFDQRGETSYVHPLGYTVTNTTYRSQALSLLPGEMVYTKIEDTPLTMPAGDYAILSYRGEIVDKDGAPVALSTAYCHHWITRTLKVNPHVNRLCKGGLNYNFGIGAESRNTPAKYPAGYGQVIAAGEKWGANIHLLHTVDLAGPAKECNECWYAPGKGPKCTPARNGTFQCCGDYCPDGECSCPTKGSAPKVRTDFYLQYYLEWTRDVSSITAVEAGTYSAPGCKAFYDVTRDDRRPERVDRASFTAAADAEIVWAVGHQHTGAINISFLLNGRAVCTSRPRYGAREGVAGDELGYLVAMSRCIDETTGALQVKKGDDIGIEAWYYVGSDDRRIAPTPGGTHLNVMSYVSLAFVSSAVPPSTATCTKALQQAGCAPGTGPTCIQCAQNHAPQLRKGGCTTASVKSLCE